MTITINSYNCRAGLFLAQSKTGIYLLIIFFFAGQTVVTFIFIYFFIRICGLNFGKKQVERPNHLAAHLSPSVRLYDDKRCSSIEWQNCLSTQVIFFSFFILVYLLLFCLEIMFSSLQWRVRAQTYQSRLES